MYRESATFGEILFNVLLFSFLLYLSYKGLNIKVKKNRTLFLVAGIILFSVFSFWGSDYFHYLEVFQDSKTSHNIHHLEGVYESIMSWTTSYTLFRFLIWGLAFVLIWLAKKRVNISNEVFLFFFILVFLLRFSYARVSLSLAFLYLGYILIMNEGKKRLLSIIVGIVCIIAAFTFHRSIILVFVALLLSFFMRNVKIIVLSLCFLPVVFYVTGDLLYDYIIVNEVITNEDTLSAFNTYAQVTEGSTLSGGMGEAIGDFLESFSMYFALVVLFYYIHIKKLVNSKEDKLLFSSYFGVMYIASAFYFVTPMIYFRVLYLAMLPLVFITANIYHVVGRIKLFKYMVSLFILSRTYTLLYSLYCSLF